MLLLIAVHKVNTSKRHENAANYRDPVHDFGDVQCITPALIEAYDTESNNFPCDSYSTEIAGLGEVLADLSEAMWVTERSDAAKSGEESKHNDFEDLVQSMSVSG